MRGKIFFYIVLILIIVIAIFLGVKSFFKDKTVQVTEYTPQEEISEEQERQTLVTLYFENRETKDLMPEARLIDVKLLIENPYKTLLKLLIEGPKNEKLNAVIPNDAKIIEAKNKGNMAIVNLSFDLKEIESVHKEKIIKSITSTLTQLAEIDFVKVLMDGEELSV